ncbi:MAG TPA: hypothetical protein VGM94_02445 [Galbitalea sp.]
MRPGAGGMPVIGSSTTGAEGWAACGQAVAGGALVAALGGGADA